MPFYLTVVSPFGEYERGQIITDPLLIEQIENSQNISNCVRVIVSADQNGE
jgi:hypothetical protein